MRLFTAIAIKGDPRAQLELAWMYRSGVGCTADELQAAYWMGRLTDQAEAGCGEARWELYEHYLTDNALGVPFLHKGTKFWSEPAQRWLMAAVESENPAAMFELALRYEAGYGGFKKNVRKFRHWLTKAVAAKHPQALVHKSFSYFRNGKPTKRAVALLEQAEKLGALDANLYLALAVQK